MRRCFARALSPTCFSSQPTRILARARVPARSPPPSYPAAPSTTDRPGTRADVSGPHADALPVCIVCVHVWVFQCEMDLHMHACTHPNACTCTAEFLCSCICANAQAGTQRYNAKVARQFYCGCTFLVLSLKILFLTLSLSPCSLLNSHARTDTHSADIAKLHGITPDMVVAGSGSDDILGELKPVVSGCSVQMCVSG